MSKDYSKSQSEALRQIDWAQDESTPIISVDKAENLSPFNNRVLVLAEKSPIRIAWEHNSD